MPPAVTIEFVPIDAGTVSSHSTPDSGPSVLVAFAGDDLALSAKTAETLGPASGRNNRAAKAANFKGKNGSALDILALEGVGVDRLLVLGTGSGPKTEALEDTLPDYAGLGGA